MDEISKNVALNDVLLGVFTFKRKSPTGGCAYGMLLNARNLRPCKLVPKVPFTKPYFVFTIVSSAEVDTMNNNFTKMQNIVDIFTNETEKMVEVKNVQSILKSNERTLFEFVFCMSGGSVFVKALDNLKREKNGS